MRILLLILVLLSAQWSWAASHCPETLEVSEQCMEVPCAKALFSQGPLTNEYDTQVQVPTTPANTHCGYHGRMLDPPIW